MVGDDIVSDIGGAQACGIRGIQVRTGKYRFTLSYYFCYIVLLFFALYIIMTCIGIKNA